MPEDMQSRRLNAADTYQTSFLPDAPEFTFRTERDHKVHITRVRDPPSILYLPHGREAFGGHPRRLKGRVLRIRWNEKKRDLTMSIARPVVAAMLFGTAMSAHANQILTFDGVGVSRHLAMGFNSSLSSDSDALVKFMDPILVGEPVAFEVLDTLQSSVFTLDQEMLCSTQTELNDDLFCRYINLCTGGLSLDTRLIDIFDLDSATSATQLAIWEITQALLSESSRATAKNELSRQLGAFRPYNTSDYSYASNDSEDATVFIFSSLGNDGWQSTQDNNLQGLSGQGSLNQVMVVPLPIPAVLAGTGLAFLVISRRRRRAQDS